MNLMLFEAHELTRAGQVVLRDRRAEHLIRVLRVRPGQRLQAGVWRGARGTAEVLSASPTEVGLRVDLVGPPPAVPKVDLVLALPRPKVLSRALEIAASFGVRHVDLVNAWRVDKSYFDSPKLETEELARHARLGCEQGGCSWLPDITVHRLFLPFLEEELKPRLEQQGLRHRLLAHPHSPTWLDAPLELDAKDHVVLAIGPEGGWIDQEISSFRDADFLPVALSRAILRVESALAAGLAQLELIRHSVGLRDPVSDPKLTRQSQNQTGRSV
ncbi:16S rRNA (uracil(1498)-N(3))-methyltransferase [Myxococcota bacterium]